jgi:hypothetical protein
MKTATQRQHSILLSVLFAAVFPPLIAIASDARRLSPNSPVVTQPAGADGEELRASSAPNILSIEQGKAQTVATPELSAYQDKKTQVIRLGPTIGSSALLFLISQGFRVGTQPETREALKGSYFKDYSESLKGLGGWSDDDPPLTNYVAHPIQGSTTTWILVHNDAKGAPQEFNHKSKRYWISRAKGMAYSAGYSAFYELSPVGDAAVGNLGVNRDYKGAVDLVITPTVGLAWHLTEDVLDRYFITWVEKKSGNIFLTSMTRTWLNPTRSFANILRFKAPWRRETRMGVRGMKRKYHGDPVPTRHRMAGNVLLGTSIGDQSVAQK